MNHKALRSFAFCLTTLATILGFSNNSFGQQYHPEHETVRAMVDRAVNFLSSVNPTDASGEWEGGTSILIGYTILKATGDNKHPRVLAGVARASQVANSLAARYEGESKIVYVASVAAILMVEVDFGKYKNDVEKILAFLLSVQKAHGGWGYVSKSTGDTSQVQYVLLALWSMQKAGMEVPPPAVEAVLRYLKATHDPSGGWGYQGKIGPGGALVAQDTVNKSLATAGACAILIGGDILGFYREMKVTDEDEGIPEAFVRTDLIAKRRAERKNITMTRQDTDGVVENAIRYQQKVRWTSGYWYYYWRYSQERYESFVEVVNGKQEKSPAWYNQGVTELAGLQEANGAFNKNKVADYPNDDVCTCFAVLFLIRSTQKAIGKLNEGLLGGGYGLPDDLSKIRRVGDRIVSDAEANVDNMLAMMEDESAGNVEFSLLPENLQLSKDPVKRKAQVARISRLLVAKEYKSRQIAAKLLGRSEDFDQGPELIYALLDTDPYVPMIAEESLRLLSRKLTGNPDGKLGLNPNLQQKRDAQKYWKQWYLGLRPDYVFIEQY